MSGPYLQHTIVSSQIDVFEIHPAITLSTNNEITLCSYYVKLSATLCEQLHTLVASAMRIFFDCPKLRNTRARRR